MPETCRAREESPGRTLAAQIDEWKLTHAYGMIVSVGVPLLVELPVPVLAVPAAFSAASFAWLTLSVRASPLLYTWANLVTLLRLTFAIGMLGFGTHCTDLQMGWAALIFVAGDFLDGFLARRLDQCSELGASLDESSDAFGTFVCGGVLWARGLAHGSVLHMALATYFGQIIMRFCTARALNWRFAYARTMAGAMALCCVASFFLAHGVSAAAGRAAGNVAVACNTLSFGTFYHTILTARPPGKGAAAAGAVAPPASPRCSPRALELASAGLLLYTALRRESGAVGGADGSGVASGGSRPTLARGGLEDLLGFACWKRSSDDSSPEGST
jgi:phosphatidylglycerophosphate synthase